MVMNNIQIYVYIIQIIHNIIYRFINTIYKLYITQLYDSKKLCDLQKER